MGQAEVLDWLQRNTHRSYDGYFTVADIRDGLRKEGVSTTAANVRAQLLKLARFEIVEPALTRQGWPSLPYRWRLPVEEKPGKGE